MSDPLTSIAWLSLIGLGEDGPEGLSSASRKALDGAEFVFGGPRHLALAGVAGARARAWTVPFSVDPVLALRGHKVVVLASGDPFWHGAGGSLIAHLTPGEWHSAPQPSSFALAANRLGWRLEDCRCFGLHAAPFAQLRRSLGKGQRLICLLRDGEAPAKLAAWLTEQGCGDSTLHVLESLGGPNERLRNARADRFDLADCRAPLAVAVDLASAGGLPRSAGLPDECFAHDGQITKRPIRALTLSALAPRGGELLWDFGAGSGSISVEWCLAGGLALAVEARKDRAANIQENIENFGLLAQMRVIRAKVENGQIPPEMAGLPLPDAVFIGGGANDALLQTLHNTLPQGTRLVVNGVTLETEMLLAGWQAKIGGDLLRIDTAQAAPLGQMRGWAAARPVTQWGVTL